MQDDLADTIEQHQIVHGCASSHQNQHHEESGMTQTTTATFLTPDTAFRDGPSLWLDEDVDTWLHEGHVDEATIEAAVRASRFELTITPGTLNHTWVQIAEHEPDDGEFICDDTFCDCRIAGEGGIGLWIGVTDRHADGAIPVTLASTEKPANAA